MWTIYHLIIKRDIIGFFTKKAYAGFGANSKLFKPYISDKNRKRVSVGNGTSIGKYSRIQCYPSEGVSGNETFISIGNGCIIGHRLTILCGGSITIEDHVLIASDVLITSENHSMNPESEYYYMDQPLINKEVHIKEGCWIGEKVCILPGVTIGKKAIIGAGSIVTKNIPDYCIAAGNPARVIKKYNFSQHRWETYGEERK